MTLRIGGVAAIVGGALWLASLAGASAIQGPGRQAWQGLFVVATVALLVAMIGLSGDQGRRQPGLVWAAVAIPIVGAAISAIGMVGMAVVGDGPFLLGISSWELWALGTVALIIGSGLFALASMRVRGVSRVGALLLVLAAAAALPALLGVASPYGAGAVGDAIAILGIFAFAAGWVWLGISAIRADRPGPVGYGEAMP